MKQKALTAISALMLFIPWTILPLRTFPWALKSPTAEILIGAYAAFMIFSGIFTFLAYQKGKAQSNLMKLCAVINSVDAVVVIAAFCMMIAGQIK